MPPQQEHTEFSEYKNFSKCSSTCHLQEYCQEGRNLLSRIRTAKTYEDQKKAREEMVKNLDDNKFSLATKFCYNGSTTIIKAVLEEVPDGVEIIADQLNKVKHIDMSDPSQSVAVNVGDGKLFVPHRPFDQALVLSELLNVRARTKKGSSQDALTCLLMHPVMVTFILEKWRHVKFSFFIHLRLWILFLLSYSLFLRIDINRHLARRDFLNASAPDTSIIRCMESDCFQWASSKNNCTPSNESYTMGQFLLNMPNQSESDLEMQMRAKICHPDPELTKDSSRLTILAGGLFVFIFMLAKLFLMFRLQIYESTATSCNQWLTVSTFVTALVFIGIAFHVDSSNIDLVTGPPCVYWDSGMCILENAIVLFSLYHIATLVSKIFCYEIIENQIFLVYHIDPEEYMQWYTLVSSLVAVFAQNHQLENSFLNGTTAISIALAGAVLVIKIGQADYTSFANFSTSFHIILRTTPVYFVAFLILNHGFSFGFWILESQLQTDEEHFTDYWRSSVSVFMMAFGIEEFDFEGPFKYQPETRGYVTTIFAYLLLVLMVLLMCLCILNLLLSTIIKNHNESKAEVVLNNLIFMAKYAIWMDFVSAALRKCGCGDWLVEKISINNGRCVTFCTLAFCPNQVKKVQKKRFLCCPTGHWEKLNRIHIAPHFEWVINELRAIDLKTLLTMWMEENKGKEGQNQVVEWGRLEQLLNSTTIEEVKLQTPDVRSSSVFHRLNR